MASLSRFSCGSLAMLVACLTDLLELGEVVALFEDELTVEGDSELTVDEGVANVASR